MHTQKRVLAEQEPVQIIVSSAFDLCEKGVREDESKRGKERSRKIENLYFVQVG